MCQLFLAKMYTRQQASLIKQQFWTRFGQYMRPVKDADGNFINWLNYKTGIRHLYFRMDADSNQSEIAIMLTQTDASQQQYYFEKLLALKPILASSTGEEWEWELFDSNEETKKISSISKTLTGVNIYNEKDWPAIISFLKPRIIALDNFWAMVKDSFE